MSIPNPEPEITFLLKLMRYRTSEACDAVRELESGLAKGPARFQIDLMGFGDIQPDMALQIRSALQERSPRTRVTTCARSSLRGSAVLVWLLGDHRLIREDARLFFRQPHEGPSDVNSPVDEDGWQEREQPSLEELFEAGDEVEKEDYRRVVSLIGNYLPVHEMAGQQLEFKTLKQFGLVESEGMDQMLNATFSNPRTPANAEDHSKAQAELEEKLQRPTKHPLRPDCNPEKGPLPPCP